MAGQYDEAIKKFFGRDSATIARVNNFEQSPYDVPAMQAALMVPGGAITKLGSKVIPFYGQYPIRMIKKDIKKQMSGKPNPNSSLNVIPANLEVSELETP